MKTPQYCGHVVCGGSMYAVTLDSYNSPIQLMPLAEAAARDEGPREFVMNYYLERRGCRNVRR